MTKEMSGTKVDVDGLYRRYGPMVLRRCQALLKDGDAAEDAMQETFVRLLRHQDTLNADYPSSLLYRIATNVCLNVMRTGRRKPALNATPILDEMPGRDNVEERALDAMLVEQVFNGVKESTRLAARIHSISGVRKRLDSLRRQSLVRAAR